MKILIINPYSFFQYKGGVERYCQILEKALLLEKRVDVFQLNGYYFKIFGYPFPKISIIGRIRKENPDIVHFNGPYLFSTIVGFYSKILRKKTILTYQAHVNPKNFFKKIIAVLERFSLKYIFDFVIVTSDTYKEKVKRFFPEKRMETIPLLIEDNFLKFGRTKKECREELFLDSGNLILFVGKLDSHHYYKGVDVLLRSVKLLSEDGNFKLILIGDGNKKKEYEEMTLFLGIKEKVKFVGQVTESELMKYYRASDVFVLPSNSDSEGFGFVLLEAIAMDLPVITTNVVGSSKMIENTSAGIVIPANDAKTLSDSIKMLSQEESLREELKENGAKFIKSFSIKENINKFLDVYEKLNLKR